MSAKIASWSDPRQPREGLVGQSISIDWREDGRVEIDARDQQGREVVLVIPNFAWKRIAMEISWNAPRREASLIAARMGMAPELPSAG